MENPPGVQVPSFEIRYLLNAGGRLWICILNTHEYDYCKCLCCCRVSNYSTCTVLNHGNVQVVDRPKKVFNDLEENKTLLH